VNAPYLISSSTNKQYQYQQKDHPKGERLP